MSAIKKRDLSIFCLLKESTLILEQTNRSYGGLKLGLFVQFQQVPFGKSTQIYMFINMYKGTLHSRNFMLCLV